MELKFLIEFLKSIFDNPMTISSIALVLSIFNFFLYLREVQRDRSDLALACEYVPNTGAGIGFKVTVTNKGRRPTTIDSIFLVTRSGNRYSYMKDQVTKMAEYPIDLPAKLEETEKCDVLFLIWHLRPKIRDPRKFKSVKVFDTRGNKKSLSLRKITSSIQDSGKFLETQEKES